MEKRFVNTFMRRAYLLAKLDTLHNRKMAFINEQIAHKQAQRKQIEWEIYHPKTAACLAHLPYITKVMCYLVGGILWIPFIMVVFLAFVDHVFGLVSMIMAGKSFPVFVVVFSKVCEAALEDGAWPLHWWYRYQCMFIVKIGKELSNITVSLQR